MYSSSKSVAPTDAGRCSYSVEGPPRAGIGGGVVINKKNGWESGWEKEKYGVRVLDFVFQMKFLKINFVFKIGCVGKEKKS
jgi:hypothetical protein